MIKNNIVDIARRSLLLKPIIRMLDTPAPLGLKKFLVSNIFPSSDYRESLFEELIRYLEGSRPTDVLEIGPRDGKDTERLLSLNNVQAPRSQMDII